MSTPNDDPMNHNDNGEAPASPRQTEPDPLGQLLSAASRGHPDPVLPNPWSHHAEYCVIYHTAGCEICATYARHVAQAALEKDAHHCATVDALLDSLWEGRMRHRVDRNWDHGYDVGKAQSSKEDTLTIERLSSELAALKQLHALCGREPSASSASQSKEKGPAEPAPQPQPGKYADWTAKHVREIDPSDDSDEVDFHPPPMKKDRKARVFKKPRVTPPSPGTRSLTGPFARSTPIWDRFVAEDPDTVMDRVHWLCERRYLPEFGPLWEEIHDLGHTHARMTPEQVVMIRTPRRTGESLWEMLHNNPTSRPAAVRNNGNHADDWEPADVLAWDILRRFQASGAIRTMALRLVQTRFLWPTDGSTRLTRLTRGPAIQFMGVAGEQAILNHMRHIGVTRYIFEHSLEPYVREMARVDPNSYAGSAAAQGPLPGLPPPPPPPTITPAVAAQTANIISNALQQSAQQAVNAAAGLLPGTPSGPTPINGRVGPRTHTGPTAALNAQPQAPGPGPAPTPAAQPQTPAVDPSTSQSQTAHPGGAPSDTDSNVDEDMQTQ